MAKSLFETHVLIPQHEYMILKEKSKKEELPATYDLQKLKVGEGEIKKGVTQVPTSVPGIPENALGELASPKKDISNNWGILWESIY